MSEAYQCFQRGLAALAAGRADEAIVPLQRAARLQPDSMSVHEALGQTWLRLRFYDRARDVFQYIVDREPQDDYAHFCLGRAFERLGQMDAASRHYKIATVMKPEREEYREILVEFLAREFPDQAWPA